MKRRKTPQEKKANEYTKDHIVVTECRRCFRIGYPRARKWANQKYRRRVKQLVNGFAAHEENDFPDKAHPNLIRREKVTKTSGVSPLGEFIGRRTEARVRRTAQNYFRYSYTGTDDREGFIAFLRSQIVGRTAYSSRIADYLGNLIDPSGRPAGESARYFWDKEHAWLRAFFHDEPEWEARVRAWISSFDDVQEES
jgi:hypothetical protein